MGSECSSDSDVDEVMLCFINEQKLSPGHWLLSSTKSFKFGSQEPWESECSSDSDATE